MLAATQDLGWQLVVGGLLLFVVAAIAWRMLRGVQSAKAGFSLIATGRTLDTMIKEARKTGIPGLNTLLEQLEKQRVVTDYEREMIRQEIEQLKLEEERDGYLPKRKEPEKKPPSVGEKVVRLKAECDEECQAVSGGKPPEELDDHTREIFEGIKTKYAEKIARILELEQA